MANGDAPRGADALWDCGLFTLGLGIGVGLCVLQQLWVDQSPAATIEEPYRALDL